MSTLRVGSTQAQSGEPGGVSTIRVGLTQAQSREPKQRHWYLTQELRFQV